MVEPITREAFLARLRTARSAWDAALDRLGRSLLDRPGFCGPWSARDVIKHVAWYEQEMINVLEARAFVSSPLWELSQKERNAAIHAIPTDLSSQALLRQERLTYAHLLALIESLQDTALNQPQFFPGMPADWHPWQVFASNTYEHYEDHLVHAEAFARVAQGTSSGAA